MSFVPNTTPTPNWLYNGEMKKMNETELKVVLLITRKTLGWFDPMTKDRKMQDYISQSQFIEFTGQKSNTSIANAIQSCVEHGWIVAKDREGNLCDSPEKRARRKIWYQLGTVFTNKISGTENEPDENESGTENASHLVQKVDSTKESITKETSETSSQDIKIVKDEDEKTSKPEKKDTSYLEVFLLWGPKYPLNWRVNRTEITAAKNILAERSLETAKTALSFYKKYKDEEWCPSILKPSDLDRKWVNLQSFRDKTL